MHKIGTDRDCCEKSVHIEIVQEVKEIEFVFLNHSSKLKIDVIHFINKHISFLVLVQNQYRVNS